MNKRNILLYHQSFQLNPFQSKSKILLKLFLVIVISLGKERIFFNRVL